MLVLGNFFGGGVTGVGGWDVVVAWEVGARGEEGAARLAIAQDFWPR